MRRFIHKLDAELRVSVTARMRHVYVLLFFVDFACRGKEASLLLGEKELYGAASATFVDLAIPQSTFYAWDTFAERYRSSRGRGDIADAPEFISWAGS